MTKGRRLRIFAGPNGSGKSTIFDEIDLSYDLGYYINPDIIEKEIKKDGTFDISSFGIKSITPEDFYLFIKDHSLISKAKEKGAQINLYFEEGKIQVVQKEKLSYEAALIADFLRFALIQKGSKLTFETVMSHESKIKIIDYAREQGYKVYLYFICTESPKINIARVESRVQKHGHYVKPEDIESRYYKSLALLKLAVKKSYRAFLYDNSGQSSKLILQVFNGEEVTFHSEVIPGWVNDYLLNLKGE